MNGIWIKQISAQKQGEKGRKKRYLGIFQQSTFDFTSLRSSNRSSTSSPIRVGERGEECRFEVVTNENYYSKINENPYSKIMWITIRNY